MNIFEERRRHRAYIKDTLKLPSFKWGKDTYYIDSRGMYVNGTPYVQCLMENGGCWGILSCNLPKETAMLGAGEFFAKTWSENEGWSQAALDSGIFVDTGVRVRTGFVEAQIWRFNF